MAITFLQQKKAQKNLILVFIGTVLIISIVVWLGFFRKEAEIPTEELPLILPKEIKINFKILESPFLKELQPFPEIEPFKEIIPVEGETEEIEGKIGRENPFIPY